MDRVWGWFGLADVPPGQPRTTPVLDLNLSDFSSVGADASSSSAATEAAMQATAAAVAAAAAAGADQSPASSSSSSSSPSSSTADAGPPSEASTSQSEEEPQDGNPMLQTSLTKRFRGKIQPLQMPTYESMMQEDFMNNCAVRSAIAGTMGGALGVAFGIFTASLDTQVRAAMCNRATSFGGGGCYTWARLLNTTFVVGGLDRMCLSMGVQLAVSVSCWCGPQQLLCTSYMAFSVKLCSECTFCKVLAGACCNGCHPVPCTRCSQRTLNTTSQAHDFIMKQTRCAAMPATLSSEFRVSLQTSMPVAAAAAAAAAAAGTCPRV
jgi:hypothetical protein